MPTAKPKSRKNKPANLEHIYQQIAMGLPDSEILLNRPEAATFLKVSELTLKKWGQRIPYARAGRLCWYTLKNLKREVERRRLGHAA